MHKISGPEAIDLDLVYFRRTLDFIEEYLPSQKEDIAKLKKQINLLEDAMIVYHLECDRLSDSRTICVIIPEIWLNIIHKLPEQP